MTFYQMMTNKKEEAETPSLMTGTTGAGTRTTADRVEEVLKNDKNLEKEVVLDKEEMMDRAKAFEKYRRYYRKNQYMEESKAVLKEKMMEGKNTGIEAKEIKDEMKALTSKIEELRRERVMRGMVEEGGPMESEEESKLQSQLSALKSEYQGRYSRLKTLKAEIDRLKLQIDRCWKQLQKDFAEWHKMYGKAQERAQGKAPLDMTSDRQVQDDLKAFYKAKEQIYNKK